MQHPKLLIAIAGTLGSGKDTAGEYLAAKYGMRHVSAGDVLRTEARLQGYTDPLSREVLGEVGDELEKNYGPGPITRRALAQYEQVVEQFPGGLVLSGIRRMPEVERLKQNGALIIFIDASAELRYQRVIGRSRGDDAPSLESFQQRERAELYGETPEGKNGLYILGVKKEADVIIRNNQGLAKLHQALDRLIVAAQKDS